MSTVLDPQTDPTSRILVPSEGQDKSSIAFTSVAVTEHSGRMYIAAGSLDGGVRIWDATSGGLGDVVGTLREHEDSVYSVKFVDGVGSRRGLGVVSGSVDRTLKRWELEWSQEKRESTCGRTLRGHKVFFFFCCYTLLVNGVCPTGCRTRYSHHKGGSKL
jgi:WD40 repeat protein